MMRHQKRSSIRSSKAMKRGGALRNSVFHAWTVALAALTLCLAAPATQAHANPLDDLGNWFSNAGTAVAEFFGVEGRALSDHTVETVDPQGTTINLFDYWGVENPQGGNDYNDNNPNAGINAGHRLKFTLGVENDQINSWTESNKPCTGIVSNVLGPDGYPVLNRSVTNSNESLAYLFNAESGTGKRAYTDVKGLLQVDDDGYYYYNSGSTTRNSYNQTAPGKREGNFASFDTVSKTFTVYDAPAVNHRASQSGDGRPPYAWTEGQFFPFTPANTVFIEQNGRLYSKGDFGSASGATQAGLNHYFGLTMTTRFLQMPDGETLNGDAITYEFTGDDDVWVFIDDVLVGDLGGIHDAASLSINFSTGRIVINDDTRNATTIRQKFQNAGVDAEWGSGRQQNTFADNTLHTLKFFYLERGNVASNMHLKTNLVSTPETEVVKVDQAGNPVPGVSFALYATGDDYAVAPNASSICSGTTDADGRLVLVDASDDIVTFDKLAEDYGTDNFVLRETEGSDRGPQYRKTGDMHLRYVSEGQSNPELGTGFVISENYIDTGAFANARETVVSPAPDAMTLLQSRPDGDNTIPTDRDGKIDGTMFAVPLKRKYENGQWADWTKDENWSGVYGSALNGWKLGDGNGKSSAVDAAVKQAQSGSALTFELNPNGLYQLYAEELPGDIQYYYYALPENRREAETQYALAFYWTSADSVTGATAGNTYQVRNEGFTRQFAAELNVPNVYNDLVVQKVDQAGKPVNGATFGLFADGSQISNGDGTYSISPDATPIATQVTKPFEDSDGSTRDGIAMFEGRMTVNGRPNTPVLLTDNYYYVAEMTAPNGYALNTNAVRVYVSDNGVFIDAGVEGDGIVARRGVGSLLSTMDQFAENPKIEATLTDIVSKLYTYKGDDIRENQGLADGWNPVDDQTVHLNYHANNVRQEYAPNDQGKSPLVSTDTDWARLKIEQCTEDHGGAQVSAYKEPLGDKDLNQLFSGLAIIEVTDKQVNDLEISKTLNGYADIDNGKLEQLRENEEFTFTATFTEPDDYASENPKMVPLTGDYSVKIVDANGDAVGDPIKVNDKGKVEFKLMHGQTAIVEDLPVQVEYTVEEQEPTTALYETNVKVNDGTAVEKRLVSGDMSDAVEDPDDPTVDAVEIDYTNTYTLTPVATEEIINFTKTFVHADDDAKSAWKKGDSFTFQLYPQDSTNPMPEGYAGTGGAPATAEITSEEDGGDVSRSGSFTFAEGSFKAPGEYVYFLSEVPSAEALPGVSYSKARFKIVVSVKDDGNGVLTAQTTVTRTHDNEGNVPGDGGAWVGDPTFTNTYNPDAADFIVGAYKVVERFGSNEKPADKTYHFKLTALSGKDESGAAIPLADVPMPDGATGTTAEADNNGYLVSFAGIGFAAKDSGHTYVYSIEEVQPDPVAPGMTYDKNVYQVTISVKEIGGVVQVSAEYKKSDGTDIDADRMHNGLPAFINTYTASNAALDLTGAKTVTGPWSGGLDGFGFTLALTEAQPANGVDESNLPKTVKTNAKGEFSFEGITFTKPGTYTFSVTETEFKGGSNKGWQNDIDPRYIHVTVDDGAGKLVATIEQDTSDKLEFTNEYAASAKVTIAGSKELTGRPFAADDVFTIEVDGEDEDGADAPMPRYAADGTYELKGLNSISSNPYKFSFGEITFTEPGTYTYNFKEKLPKDDNDQLDGYQSEGVTYDETAYKVEFVVDDNQDGTLKVTTKLNDNDIDADTAVEGLAWVNHYGTSETTLSGAASLSGVKTLTGREWADGDAFTFVLAPANDATAEAVEDGSVKLPVETVTVDKEDLKVGSTTEAPFSFGDITFTKPTTRGHGYLFKITEQIPEDAVNNVKDGITYDEHELIIRVAVEDKGDGTLDAHVVRESGAMMWENVYRAVMPGDTDITPKFTKVFTGRDWTVDDNFKFAIASDTPNAPMPVNDKGEEVTEVTVNGDGASALADNAKGGSKEFSFGRLVFTMDNMEGATDNGQGGRTKTFNYTVTEDSSDKIAGVDYEDTAATFTVTVTDDGMGNLTAVLGVMQNATFTNAYQSGSVDLDNLAAVQIVKNLKDRDIMGDEFEFTMTAHNDNAKAKAQKIAGFTDGVRTFETAGASMKGDTATETISAGTGLVFSLDDAGKDFIFKVAETHPEEGADQGHVHNGVTYDDHEYTLKFTVADDGKGTLTVTAYVDDVAEPAAQWTNTVQPAAVTDKVVTLEFYNSYNPGEVVVGGTGITISAAKELTGRPMEAGEFKFDVVNVKDTNKTVICTGTNDANGNVAFPAIEYDIDKLIADNTSSPKLNDLSALPTGEDVYTYTYSVIEQKTNLPDGVSVEDGAGTFVVKITDDHKGALKGEVFYGANEPNGMVFKNTYNADDVKLVISGVKNIESNSDAYTPTHDELADHYTFKLSAVTPGAPMPAAGGETAKMDSAGDIRFGEITYTLDNVWPEGTVTADSDEATADGEPAPAAAMRSKTFTYEVKEEGSLSYIENDKVNPKIVEVEVADNGSGELSVKTKKPVNARHFTFTNTYRVDEQPSSVSDAFSFTKKLTGRDLKAEEFSFELKSLDGTFDPVVAKNDADGKITFPKLTFSKAGAYRFELSEVAGDLGGVTYDQDKYTVVATVADQHDGTLKVSWSFEGDNAPEGTDVVFENAYTTKGTEVRLGATKLLDGRAIKKGEFTFELREGDKVIAKAKNDAPNNDGSATVTFDAISYDKPGEHTYTIAEVKGDAKNVTYDTTEFTAHVSVTDNGSGELVAKVSYDKDLAPVFKNVYDEPEKPGPGLEPSDPPKPSDPPAGGGDTGDGDKETLPGTGDASLMAVAACGAAGAAVATAGLFAAKRKRNNA